MPKRRQPWEVWEITRKRIWLRDGKKCVRCGVSLKLNECHINHIISGKLGTNEDHNLRTLCPNCHALRADLRHNGMRGRAVAKGIIPPNWRELVWEDDELDDIK